MKSKKWLVAAISAVSLTTVAGTSAFALQDGGNGGEGGEGGRGGDFAGDVDADGGDADVEGNGACDNNNAVDNAEGYTNCRGFNARGGAARLSARTGNGGNGGRGGRGGGGGNRTTIRRTAGGFPF